MPGLELQAVARNPLAELANAALTDEASAKKEKQKELAKLRSRRQAARAKEALAKVPVLEARVAELEAQLKQANETAARLSTDLNAAAATIAQLQKEVRPIFSRSLQARL